jgi:hypothetical protein
LMWLRKESKHFADKKIVMNIHPTILTHNTTRLMCKNNSSKDSDLSAVPG